MKKFLALVLVTSVFAVSSFAQTVPNRSPAEAGARIIAEHDAAWLKAHPGSVKAKVPNAHSAAKHVQHAQHSSHAKKSQNVRHNKHGKKIKHTKPKTI